MDFWKSSIVLWCVRGIAGVVVAHAAKLGLPLDQTQEQVADAIITVGTVVTFGIIILRRSKGNPPAINRDTVPTPVAKMAGIIQTKNRGNQS